jgi:uncharacterized protein
LQITPCSIQEIQSAFSLQDVDRLLFNGFYPRIWDKQLNPIQVLGDYLETYVEKDL